MQEGTREERLLCKKTADKNFSAPALQVPSRNSDGNTTPQQLCERMLLSPHSATSHIVNRDKSAQICPEQALTAGNIFYYIPMIEI